MRRIHSARVFVVLVAALLGHCVAVKPVHDVFTTPNEALHKNPNPAAQTGPLKNDAQLRVVELDDQGELWSPAQLRGVVKDIRRMRAPEGALVLVFVHGWNQWASPNPNTGGENLKAFKITLEKLGAAMKELPADERQAVFGVFIGWNGRTFKSVPVGLDYFQRRASGQRAGGAGGTFALMEILSAARADKKNSPIVVGHSFGALMVERALAPVIEADVARRNPRPVADLVLLINEAENALTAHELMVALKDRKVSRSGHGRPFSPPLIVSIASDSDWATRAALPAGAFVGRNLVSLTNTTNSGRLRRSDLNDPEDGGYPPGMSQRTALYHAPAHIDALHSHEELSRKSSTGISGGYAPIIAANQHPVQGDRLVIHGSNGDYELRERQKPWNDTPYWVFRVPDDFLHGHNGLGDENGGASGNVIALITALASLGDGAGPVSRATTRMMKPIRQVTPMTYKE